MNVVEALHLPGIEASLGRVELALSAATRADDPFLSEVAGHLVQAGGKRLRPALTVAAAQACGSDVTGDVIQGGVSVELVHLGSLYHDDVMDEATSRRGVESVNSRWGNLVAILAGDFLLARASEIASSLGTEVAGLMARTISRLCEGEVGQLRYAFDTSRTEAAYFSSIGGKTASLMSTAARVGGLTAGADQAIVEALTDYGYALGITFQIWDDIRDLVATDDVLGKPAGHDLVEGTYTLPVLRALAVPGVGGDLGALLGSPLDAPARDKARDLVLSTPAIASSITTGREWADRAADALDLLGDCQVLAGVGHRLLDDLTE
ncbi:MAG TPA: polyprenyl synthetase family protein [Acidimicrobiales bacterium]|jgi:heptaprenyl diphosphate synthase|nr:polyprenyl synthetase family protein [Acidimicrobiales bacterium]